MFIDMHVHTRLFPGPERLSGGTYATPEELLTMLRPHGIRRAVILPGVNPECSYVPQGVGEVLAVCEKYPDFFIPFMNVDPRAVGNAPKADLGHLMRYWKERGCKGIGEVCANLSFDDPLMQNLFRHAEANDLPVVFHVAPRAGGYYGIVDELGLPGLERALARFPALRFIGHSQPFWAEISGDLTEDLRNTYPKGPVLPGGAAVRLLRRYPNLLGDLSPAAGSGYNAVSRDPAFGYTFLEEFQDRLFFATDICDPRNRLDLIPFLNDAVASGRISRVAYEKICYRNAEALLGVSLDGDLPARPRALR
ncbi:MAG: amidohydrolase family protein [Lentisphaeria bacterium]|nr:amidohydrolase family protein [Lentisphaeria bacterium]